MSDMQVPMDDESLQNEESGLVPLYCKGCSVEFHITRKLAEIRLEDHGTFWCPNGHTLNFKKPEELVQHEAQIESLSREVKRLNSEIAIMKSNAERSDRYIDELEGRKPECWICRMTTTLENWALAHRGKGRGG